MKIAAVIPVRVAAHWAGNLAWWAMDDLPFHRLLGGFHRRITGEVFTLQPEVANPAGHRLVPVSDIAPPQPDVACFGMQLAPFGRIMKVLLDNIIKQLADRNKEL
jgi:hypothetical protein